MTEQKITVHEKTFAIAWGDMDALGHVNNARYFDYFGYRQKMGQNQI